MGTLCYTYTHTHTLLRTHKNRDAPPKHTPHTHSYTHTLTHTFSTHRDAPPEPGSAEELAEQLVQQFEDQWGPAMEALQTAAETFDNLEGVWGGVGGWRWVGACNQECVCVGVPW